MNEDLTDTLLNQVKRVDYSEEDNGARTGGGSAFQKSRTGIRLDSEINSEVIVGGLVEDIEKLEQQTSSQPLDSQYVFANSQKQTPDTQNPFTKDFNVSRRSSVAGTGFEKLATNLTEENELDTFFKGADRLFLVLTSAGKPVFTSHGDIYHLSPIIATLYAIISKVETFNAKHQQTKWEREQEEAEKQKLSRRVKNRITQTAQELLKEGDPFALSNASTGDLIKLDTSKADLEKEMDDSAKSSMRHFHGKGFKVAILRKGGSLIYFGLSKLKHESTAMIRRELEVLHLQLISITTTQLIKTLQFNPSFDVLTDIAPHSNLIHEQIDNMWADPFTWTGFMLPLRVHADTREMISQIVARLKPDNTGYYFGAVLAEKTVVAIIKNDPKITVIPTDINLLFNYLNANEEHLIDNSPCFVAMCLPGMTEQFKLHVFIYVDPETNLRFVFVCEDDNDKIKDELHGFCIALLEEFNQKKLLDAIDVCETDMFSRINMGEVLNVLICNTLIEQYTVYNLPIIYPDQLHPTHIRCLQEFQGLYEKFLASPNKKDLMLKKVHALETYALLANDSKYVVMATVAHNRTEKEVFDILRGVLDDAKQDEESNFIIHWV